jgi:putative salt-induced outer membrane protein YdiY
LIPTAELIASATQSIITAIATAISINTLCGSQSNSNSNTIYDGDSADDSDLNGASDMVFDSDSDSDSSSINLDNDSDTDNEYTAGSEETLLFLYRYFIIYIIPGSVSGKPNTIFIKITLFYIKGEDNNPRV